MLHALRGVRIRAARSQSDGALHRVAYMVLEPNLVRGDRKWSGKELEACSQKDPKTQFYDSMTYQAFCIQGRTHLTARCLSVSSAE